MAIDGFALHALPDQDGDRASDADLVRQLIEGSQDALAALYDRHASAVFATAVRVSRDRGIAAEVVQETFLALWNRAELFDQSRGALPAWLQAIARNRAIDRLRNASRHDRAATFSSFGGAEADDHSTAEWLTSTGDLIGAAGPEPGPEMALADKETRESHRGRARVAGAARTARDRAGLRHRPLAIRDRGRAGLADGYGQDQDAAGPPPPARAARGVADGCGDAPDDTGAGPEWRPGLHPAVRAVRSASTTTPCISPC